MSKQQQQFASPSNSKRLSAETELKPGVSPVQPSKPKEKAFEFNPANRFPEIWMTKTGSFSMNLYVQQIREDNVRTWMWNNMDFTGVINEPENGSVHSGYVMRWFSQALASRTRLLTLRCH